jgi:hypothetical protein
MRQENAEQSQRIEARLEAQKHEYRNFEAEMKHKQQQLQTTVEARFVELQEARDTDRQESDRRYDEIMARIAALETRKHVPPVPQFPPAWQPHGGDSRASHGGESRAASTAAPSSRVHSEEAGREGFAGRFVPQI